MAEVPEVSTVTNDAVAVFRLLELTYELKAIGKQTTALLVLVQHVERNIREARRLLATREPLLSAEEVAWMRRSIQDTGEAVRSVAALIEPARVDLQTKGRLSLRTRGVWVFKDSWSANEKMVSLHMCHQTLTTLISSLHCKDVVVVRPTSDETRLAAKTPKDAPPAYNGLGDFLDWRRRRREKSAARMDPRHTSEPDVREATPEMPPLRHTHTSPPTQIRRSTDGDLNNITPQLPGGHLQPTLAEPFKQPLAHIDIPDPTLESSLWSTASELPAQSKTPSTLEPSLWSTGSELPAQCSRPSSPVSPATLGPDPVSSPGAAGVTLSAVTPPSGMLRIATDRTMVVPRDTNSPVVAMRPRRSSGQSAGIGWLWQAYQAERNDLGHQ